jgi:Ca2+-binding RTX toxin-like protein
MRHANLHHRAQANTLPGPHQNGLEHGTTSADYWVGTNFADRFDGGLGSDSIYGGNGSDVLEGSSGKDLLSGGNGSDTLRGGSGDDTFVFATVAEVGKGAECDHITDFESGYDKLDMHGFMTGGHFIDTAAFTVGGGPQVRYDKAHALLLGDVNGDGVVDFALYLNGVPKVVATDFIF